VNPFQSNHQVQTLSTSLRDSLHVISRDNLTQHAPGIDRPAALICRYAEVRTKEFIAKIGRDARMPSNRNSLNQCSIASMRARLVCTMHSAKVQNSRLHDVAAQQAYHGDSYRSSSGMRSGAEFHFLWKRETCYTSSRCFELDAFRGLELIVPRDVKLVSHLHGCRCPNNALKVLCG
jgi:hypothetical protein